MDGFQDIYVLNKRLKLRHSIEGFKTSMDSVLLAASCPAKAGDKVLDMGCGVGGAGFCLLSRVEGLKLTGVEVQSEHVDLAHYNARSNNMGEQCNFICSDIRDFRQEKAFDHVICNPPYLEAGAHLRSPSPEKATAMGGVESSCTQARGQDEADLSIKDWVDTAFHCLKPRGTLTMIHRTDFTDKIIQALDSRFGAIEVFPLWPKEGVPSKRMVLRAGCERKSPMTLYSGLVLHSENGQYMESTNKILKDIQPLF